MLKKLNVCISSFVDIKNFILLINFLLLHTHARTLLFIIFIKMYSYTHKEKRNKKLQCFVTY